MEKIGIMGGTFNPIHNSHVLLALQAKNLFGLDRVLFMPTQNPAYKTIQDNVSNQDRCEMVKLAIGSYDGLEFSDFEFQRTGLTYTSDTLELLCSENPDCRYYFIIGADSMAYFDEWHLPEVILRHSAILCAPRAKSDSTETFRSIERIRNKFTCDGFIPEIHYLATPTMDISSSLIRDFVTCGISIDGLVSENVKNYIYEHGLYRSAKFDFIKNDLMGLLTEHRYRHVLSVADYSARLALNLGYDMVKAYTAGLLHDCAKHLTNEESLIEAKRLGWKLNKAELSQPGNLLHGKIGSVYAKDKYGIEDEEILSSIYYHTTGRPGMNVLEKILYLADVLEYGRKMLYSPTLDEIRSIASVNPDLAIYHILNNMVPYLLETYKDTVCQLTLEAYEYYKALICDSQNSNI